MADDRTSPQAGLAAGGLAALGIVFGDLGTSPLYTLQTVVGDAGGGVTHEILLGSLSLLVWSLVIVVTLKYATLVMRADNNGEGGILALLSLIGERYSGRLSRGTLLTAAGLFGAALLYGDGVITPSISVLSALEGTETVTSAVKPFILPGAVVILAGLFAAQPFGTASIGVVFGPVMLLWFVSIGVLGAFDLASHPSVLAAINPLLGVRFLLHHGWGSFVVLGGVFLALTGAEALYADMGHVGRRPVRLAWLAVVFPALLLSYAGQVAVAVGHGGGSKGNPFFTAVPHALVIPVVVLATLATIIASQAIITGTFTLTRQAMQLGWFPGLNIRQTSDTEYGQIYVPVVNWIMMIGTIAIAIGFKSSSNLSGAYGTAVSTTMLMTTALIYDVMRERWRWSIAVAGLVAAFFLLVDLAFFGANLLKITQGGYVPLTIGVALFTLMLVWHRGMGLIRDGLAPLGDRVDEVLEQLRRGQITRVPGSVVFLSRSESAVPPIMARYVADFRSLPEKVVVLSVRFTQDARVGGRRVETRPIFEGIWQVTVRFGFVEIPNLANALAGAKELGCDIDLDEVLYLAGHDEIVPNERRPKMSLWQRVLFGLMYRNAVRASDRFALPRNRLVEIGHQVEV